MSELLSVIIPVYQAKEYLVQCVESVVNQTYENVEVILIDDGSTDGSSQLCDEMSKKYDNVQVRHISNCGPFQARKSGVAIASGNVVTFVDADDWIENDTYEKLMKIYQEYEPELICFAYRTSMHGTVSENYFEEGIYDKEAIEKEIISYMMYDPKVRGRRITPSVCCKILNKSLYKRVTEGVDDVITWGEDALVSYPAICHAKSMYITNEVLYHYRESSNSETRLFPSERIDELTAFFRAMSEFIEQYGGCKGLSFQLECYMRSFVEMMTVDLWGFHSRGASYKFPYDCVNEGCSVQIYGAGHVGKSYVYELLHNDSIKLKGWYDVNFAKIEEYAGIKIQSPKKIDNAKSDIVLIAVLDEIMANEIRESLILLGVESTKIVWKKPIVGY